MAPVEEKNVTVDALLDNIKLVWIEKGKQPVYRDMNVTPSKYNGSTYNARFGGWRKALEAFVQASANERFDVQAELREVENAVRTGRRPSLSLRFRILKRDNFRCIACGRSPATVSGLILEIDHLHAWSKGGRTTEQNLQTLCFDCNRGKAAE